MEFIKIIIIVILFLGTISFLSTFFMYKKLFGIRIKYNEESTNEINLKKRGVTFYSGVNRLQGYFYFKDTEINLDKEVVLIVHGYGVTHRDYILEIESFTQKNYLVFAYDMTGCGESEGKSLKGFGQFILDAKAALEYLESLNMKNKVILYGHSTGAFAVAALLSYVDKKQVSCSSCISF